MAALDAAVQIQKKKVVVGPNDAVGIVLFNTVSEQALHSTGSRATFATHGEEFTDSEE